MKKARKLRGMSHPIDRAAERYGLDLTDDDLAALVEMCGDDKKSVLRRHASGGCDERFVFYSGQPLRVVYNPERRLIVTFLPLKREYDTPRRGKPPSRAKLRRMRERRSRMEV